ncbi:MAG: hypothetical protein UT82_C0018G0002 [Parcubacteria group bacterium GW2011_GWB1_40_14]|nr:MAG: hypothetical protein UT82_C0018G0002 [Parcubacteria group bacterium GW2011_GWB1_40_14]
MEKKTDIISVEQTPQLVIGENSIKRGAKIAKELSNIINKQKLYAVIQGKKFVTVEGWNTLGAMMGVFPEVVRTEKLAGEEGEIKYLAEVRLKTPQGQVISSAQAICSNKEAIKGGKDEYVIFSMAQTRATGKAFRLAFSWIIKMAGYSPTPAEEMITLRQEEKEIQIQTADKALKSGIEQDKKEITLLAKNLGFNIQDKAKFKEQVEHTTQLPLTEENYLEIRLRLGVLWEEREMAKAGLKAEAPVEPE